MLLGIPQAILGHEPRPVKHASGLLGCSASNEGNFTPVSLAGARVQTAYRDLAPGRRCAGREAVVVHGIATLGNADEAPEILTTLFEKRRSSSPFDSRGLWAHCIRARTDAYPALSAG